MKHILLIDDEPPILKIFRLYLESLGYRVSTAANGSQGLEILAADPPDCVFCDLTMPKMDGFTVLQKVHEVDAHTPFIVFSGTGNMHDVIEALRRGAWDYLTKPVADLSVMAQMLNRIWARSDALKADLKKKLDLESLVQERTTQLEAQLVEQERTQAQLRELLKEKDVLLSEVHHRVKNNLQIILILMELQKAHISHPGMTDLLLEGQNRIYTMALIQEQLFDSHSGSRIGAKEFLTNIIYHELTSYRKTAQVNLHLEIEDSPMEPAKAFTCGLIVNELFSAVLTFADLDRSGEIHFYFRKNSGEETEMVLKENFGALARWNPQPGSLYLGYTLMKILIGETQGDIHYDSQVPDEMMIRF